MSGFMIETLWFIEQLLRFIYLFILMWLYILLDVWELCLGICDLGIALNRVAEYESTIDLAI